MLLKIFGFRAQPAPNESDSQAQSAEAQQVGMKATAGGKSAKPKRTLKRILLQWSIGTGVLGIAGVIGLPLLLNSVSCGGMIKEMEGRAYAGSMNRAQQAFYLDNGRFAQTWEELDIGTEVPSTEAYRFRTKVKGNMAFNYAEVKPLGDKPSRAERREHEQFFAVVGATALLPNQASADSLVSPSIVSTSKPDAFETKAEAASETAMTQVILCQADEPGIGTPPKPELTNGQLACAPGTTDLNYH